MFSVGNKKKPNNSRYLWFTMSPHIVMAAFLIGTNNAHLIVLPMTTAALHYMYKFNHLR